jgi:hypothetical protein
MTDTDTAVSMRKFPKVKYPNDPQTDGLLNGEVVVTEKLDGANFRFTWDDDGELHVGTRNHVYRHVDENLPKAFEHAVEYLQQVTDGWDMDRGWSEGVVFYGEAMHLHSLDYDDIDWHHPHKGSPHVPLDSDTPNVVLFDARRNGEWVHWDELSDMIAHSPFEGTRVMERGDPDELSFDVPETSMFGGQPEGIVVRRTDGSVRAKKVTDEFKERNAVSFEDTSKAKSDAAEFVAAYVTKARIEKTAHKLVDEGEYDRLEMPMMEDLPRAVLQDAMAEHGWDLLTSGWFEAEWDDDFKSQVRSRASKKCARVLKSEVQSL